MTEATTPPQPPSRRRWWPIALFVLVLLAFLAWTGFETLRAMRAVDRATEQVQSATEALGAGDIPAALVRVEQAGEQTRTAAAAADSVPLRVLGSIPWLGRDVRAARVTVHSVDAAVNTSVLPLLQSADRIKQAQDATPEGGIALDALRAETEPVSVAAAAAQAAYQPLAGIDPGSLLFLDGPVSDAQARVGQLAALTAQADGVLQVAPYLLGADEPRSFLLVFQNLSEERPTGGIFGSWALVEADQGQVSLVVAASNDIFEGVPVPWRTTPVDVQELYGEDLDEHQNVNLSPDFPVAAGLISQVWQRATGRAAPDGVIAVTPVALADALAATGPLTVEGGPELTSENAVRVLQNEVYSTHPDAGARNAYLGAVTGEVFGQVLRTGLASPGLLQNLGGAASTGHVQAWFADPRAQALAADLPVGGVLPDEPDPDQVRVYLTNTDASKLGQFTHLDVAVQCEADRPRTTMTFRYEPPAQAPDYVAGGSHPRMTHRVTVGLYLPPNRGVEALAVNGEPAQLAAGTEKGWTVARMNLVMSPDTTTTLDWDLSGTATTPAVLVQPLTNETGLPAPDTVGVDCG